MPDHKIATSARNGQPATSSQRPPCFECGAPSEVDHHIVPQSRGGTRTVPLCGSCHAKAHHRNGNMSSRRLTVAAMARKRELLEFCGGEAPYGYHLAADGVHIEPHDEEQAIIREARELRETGLSLQKIGDRLTARGLLPRSGGKWFATTIKRILDAEVASVGGAT